MWISVWKICIAVGFLSSCVGYAQEAYELKTKPKVKVRGAEFSKKSKRPQLRVARKKPAEVYRYGGELNYRIRTDLADQVEPRLYTHTLGFSYGVHYVPYALTLAAVLTAQYQSAGERRSEVIVDDNDTELFVNDVALSMQKAFTLAASTKADVTLTNEFPTSSEAKREEYRSVTTIEGNIGYGLFPKRLSVGLNFGAYYIWNSYQYSPTTFEANKRNGSYGNLGLSLVIWEGLYVAGKAGAQISTYTDGTSDMTYKNSVAAGYRWTAVAFSIGLSNGSYLDQGDASLWFVDEYRRILSASLSYSF